MNPTKTSDLARAVRAAGTTRKIYLPKSQQHGKGHGSADPELLHARDSFMKLPRFLLLTAAAAAFCATSSVLPAVTIVDARWYANAWDGVGSAGEELFTSLGIPASGTIAGTDGNNTSRFTVSQQGTGDQATFSYGMEHAREAGVPDALAQGGGQMKFTVGANTTYALSGSYAASHTGGTGEVYFAGYLYDLTAGAFLFNSVQTSQGIGNESFTLGGSGGDVFSHVSGTLTGGLLSGHTYMLSFGTRIQDLPTTNAAATATGNLTLKIGGGAPASVPEGGAGIASVVVALAALAGARRQLRR